MAIVETLTTRCCHLRKSRSLAGVQVCSWLTRPAADAEGQRPDAFQVDGQVAAERAAAQLQARRLDIGLRQGAVDVAGGDLQLGYVGLICTRSAPGSACSCWTPVSSLEIEGRAPRAVEVLRSRLSGQPELHSPGCQGGNGRPADLVAAQLQSQQHLPGLGLAPLVPRCWRSAGWCTAGGCGLRQALRLPRLAPELQASPWVSGARLALLPASYLRLANSFLPVQLAVLLGRAAQVPASGCEMVLITTCCCQGPGWCRGTCGAPGAAGVCPGS